MILEGNERGNAKKLAKHLLKGTILLLIDACKSGDIKNDDITKYILTHSNILVFSATKAHKAALEPENAEGSLFASAIVAALTDKKIEADLNQDSALSFFDIVNFVHNDVYEQSDGTQIPWAPQRDLFGDFIITRMD